ncbi:MAG TPA: hypothetical protein VMU25_03090 [Candidatus Paceibacterota bacterium]|nr:hypothetical protein [Candidatus Paceibacterota bacterium]
MDTRPLVYPFETSIEFEIVESLNVRVRRLAFPMRLFAALSLLPFYFVMSTVYVVKSSAFEFRETFREIKSTIRRN